MRGDGIRSRPPTAFHIASPIASLTTAQTPFTVITKTYEQPHHTSLTTTPIDHLQTWVHVSKSWAALEAIFLASADIRSQLPEDTKARAHALCPFPFLCACMCIYMCVHQDTAYAHPSSLSLPFLVLLAIGVGSVMRVQCR